MLLIYGCPFLLQEPDGGCPWLVDKDVQTSGKNPRLEGVLAPIVEVISKRGSARTPISKNHSEGEVSFWFASAVGHGVHTTSDMLKTFSLNPIQCKNRKPYM